MDASVFLIPALSVAVIFIYFMWQAWTGRGEQDSPVTTWVLILLPMTMFLLICLKFYVVE
jgi:hypothetical protein